MFGWKGRGMLALVLLLLVSLMVAPALAPASTRTSPGTTTVRASATTVTIHAIYADSQYLEVNWTKTKDACFGSYTFNLSTNPTSWTTSITLTDANSTAAVVLGLTGGTTYYYEITDTECMGGNSATTPVYVFTEPLPGTVGYTWVNDTSVRLHWTNNYSYGGTGNLAFVAYGVEFTNNHTVLAVIMDARTVNYTFNATSPGTYGFDILTEDSCTQCNPYNPPIFTSNAISFTTTPPVTATASATPTTTEAGVASSFTCAASSGASPYTYAWAFGDGTTGSGATTSHTFASAGSPDATCTATDAHGGTAVAHVAMTVNAGVSVAASASATSIAPGGAVLFNATGSGGTGGPYTITWNFGDGTSGTGAVATHTYANPGTYIPTVTITDSLGGTKTVTLSAITVAAPLDVALIGGIAAVIIVAALAAVFLLMRKRKKGPATPPGQTPPPSP